MPQPKREATSMTQPEDARANHTENVPVAYVPIQDVADGASLGGIADVPPERAVQQENASVSPQEKARPSTTREATDGRLHIASLWLPCLEAFFNVILPATFACLIFGPGNVIPLVIGLVVLPTAVYYALRFFTLRYRVAGTELVIQSGLVFRSERRIPFDRVQEIEIRQGIFHRLLDLAKLDIKTAGSDAEEASLSVLSKQAAESLRETIASKQRLQAFAQDDGVGVRDEQPEYVCQLSVRDLVLGGLTSTLVTSLWAVVGAIVYFQWSLKLGGRWFDEIEGDIEGRVQRRLPEGIPFDLAERLEERLPDVGPAGAIVDFVFNDTLSKSLSLALLGLVASVVTYVIRYHGFRLARNGNLLSTSHGLLTFRRGNLPRDRIQALKLEEGVLRRWCGLASVRVDSAGDRSEIDDNKKRDVLVPVASKETAQEIAKQAIPGLDDLEPSWRRISRQAVMRGSKKGWLLALLAMVQTYGMAGWLCLIWLPAIPLVYFLNYQWYRHTGYWMDEHHFLSRQGWLNRATVCLPVKNIQNVSVIQNPFDRRLNLATLSIDTAGQSNTGGGPLIRHLPVDEARNIQWTLTSHVASCQFAW